MDGYSWKSSQTDFLRCFLRYFHTTQDVMKFSDLYSVVLQYTCNSWQPTASEHAGRVFYSNGNFQSFQAVTLPQGFLKISKISSSNIKEHIIHISITELRGLQMQEYSLCGIISILVIPSSYHGTRLSKSLVTLMEVLRA